MIFALGRQNDDAAGMRILLGMRVVNIAKTGFVGELAELRFVAGEKMPARIRAFTAVAFQAGVLLGGGQRGVSPGLMLTLMMSNCLPTSILRSCSASMRPLSVSEQSIGHR